jgi:hypothetical protein
MLRVENGNALCFSRELTTACLKVARAEGGPGSSMSGGSGHITMRRRLWSSLHNVHNWGRMPFGSCAFFWNFKRPSVRLFRLIKDDQ